MSEPTGVVLPLLAIVGGATPLAEPLSSLQWAHVWLPAVGLLGMGFRNLIGGGDDDESAGEGIAGDDDFLNGDGEFEGGFDDADGGFDDGLGEEDDDPFAEVEPRISDLEADIEELSQTVSSIHGEHESMRESVEETEENVRKLLEVYEVVTQSANPFADAPDRTPSGGGDFGLLDGTDDDAGVDDPEDVGGLFDDVEDEDDDEVELDLDPDDDADDEGDGLTFDDLKSEFEFVGEDEFDDDLVPEDVELSDLHAGPDDGRSADRDRQAEAGKPYLVEVPDGYGAELLVMEWLDFLVSESSMPDALRALTYYRTVDWIADEVADDLQQVLTGMTPAPQRAATDGGMPTELTVEHHTRSLEFITRLVALAGGAGHPNGSPDGPLSGIGLGRRDHGVQR